MIVFSLTALALTGLAVAVIAPSLLNRRPLNDDDSARQNIRIARRRLRELEESAAVEGETEAAQSRAEIEASLLDDLNAPDISANQNKPPKMPGKMATAIILSSIPALGIVLYLALGNPAALTLDSASTADSSAKTPPVAELLRGLERKLADDPDNPDQWALAARAYMTIGDFANAERAYRALHRLVGDNPDLLSAWAEAEVRAANGEFLAPALARIDRALAMSPEHPAALWLAALGAEAHADYKQAMAHLQRLLPLLENPEARTEVEVFIARLRGGNANAPAGEQATRASLRVNVKIDPALADKVRADQRVYVFAKALNGMPMPLAVSRHRASQLPVSVTLDDSMAMLRDLKISNFEQVSVVARLSNSGNPVAEPGDLQSAAVVTRTDNRAALELVIDRVVGEE